MLVESQRCSECGAIPSNPTARDRAVIGGALLQFTVAAVPRWLLAALEE
jgi:hypothetical protein